MSFLTAASGRRRRISLATILFFLTGCHALSMNRTIDDEYGDSVTGLVPQYSPPGAWHQGSTCGGCFVHLDPSQVLNGTWHDATHNAGQPEPRSITMRFNGTAVYVYNVLANQVSFADTLTNLTFALDGHQVGTSLPGFEHHLHVLLIMKNRAERPSHSGKLIDCGGRALVLPLPYRLLVWTVPFTRRLCFHIHATKYNSSSVHCPALFLFF
ncbi:hypothetical protein C8Q74DRAFT_421266 [Fomes fomentarius]|nr:hypothetical protein C8Q74DRAFT_421266 [Fomes fomentarius]